MVTAADLGIQTRGGRERDAQQLQRVLALESDVEGAAHGSLLAGAAVLARQPEELRDRIAHRAQQSQPLVEGPYAGIVGLRQPEIVVGQIKLAGASRDRAAVLDGVEELR